MSASPSPRYRFRFGMATVVTCASALAIVLPGAAAAGQSLATGRSLLAAVDALPPTPNTAWGLDPATGQLLLTVSDAAPAPGAARLLALASRAGNLARTVRTHRPLAEQELIDPVSPQDGVVLGGDRISDGKILCSAGFNTERDGTPYVLTAGHCTHGLPAWQGIGPAVVSVFPGEDYGVIRNDSAFGLGDVDRYDGTEQPITSAGTAFVGERVCASGEATGLTCGRVTAVDQTVDYGDGNVVHGLIETTVRTDHGDSGGPLFDGSTGLGTVSGGDGTTDYFQPLPPVLAAYGLALAPPD